MELHSCVPFMTRANVIWDNLIEYQAGVCRRAYCCPLAQLVRNQMPSWYETGGPLEGPAVATRTDHLVYCPQRA